MHYYTILVNFCSVPQEISEMTHLGYLFAITASIATSAHASHEHLADQSAPHVNVTHAYALASNSENDQNSNENLALRKEILQFAQDTFYSLAETTGFLQYTLEAAKTFKLDDILIGIPTSVKNADNLATYKGIPWTVNGKKVKSQTLVNVQIK